VGKVTSCFGGPVGLIHMLELMMDSSTLLPYETLRNTTALELALIACRLPAHHKLTVQDLLKAGLLVGEGSLPKGFVVDPVTGNHSSFTANAYCLGVSTCNQLHVGCANTGTLLL
jgi:hypothetical protein